MSTVENVERSSGNLFTWRNWAK